MLLAPFTLRDGGIPAPLSNAELAGIIEALHFYDSTSLVPRLVATILNDRGLSSSGDGRRHA